MSLSARSSHPVFVYGTLKPGGYYFSSYCEGKVRSTLPAMIRAWLYHLPREGYPAVVLPRTCSADVPWVHGCVHFFADQADALALDPLEGYNPGAPDSENEYNRVKVTAFDSAKSPMATVWTYVMSRERVAALNGQIVAGGNWVVGLNRPAPIRPAPPSPGSGQANRPGVQ